MASRITERLTFKAFNPTVNFQMQITSVVIWRFQLLALELVLLLLQFCSHSDPGRNNTITLIIRENLDSTVSQIFNTRESRTQVNTDNWATALFISLGASQRLIFLGGFAAALKANAAVPIQEQILPTDHVALELVALQLMFCRGMTCLVFIFWLVNFWGRLVSRTNSKNELTKVYPFQ